MLVIKETETKGRGVFAGKDFAEGDIVEICPVIILPSGDVAALKDTELYNYDFIWDFEKESGCIVLGYGSLYNHSITPNALYDRDFSLKEMKFFCIKPIKCGEEIFVNYNGDPNDQSLVWFEL